jgi:8-oxo-dGTP pyrophosphatase MutT (NUDIX family)
LAETFDNPGDLDRVPAKPTRKRAVTPKHAASLIVWRDNGGEPDILMGMRHARHKFMPSVLVFPGGRVDRADHRAKVATELREDTRDLLAHRATPSLARALGVAAARELQEETGLILGDAGGFNLAALDYLCRAVTPTTRAMRFDARFLLAPASAVQGEIAGSGELENLAWYPLSQARAAQLAPITLKLLDEFADWLATPQEARHLRPRIVYRGNDNRMSDG